MNVRHYVSVAGRAQAAKTATAQEIRWISTNNKIFAERFSERSVPTTCPFLIPPDPSQTLILLCAVGGIIALNLRH